MAGLGETIMELIPDAAELPAIRVARLAIDMPVEIYPRRSAGNVTIEGTAPSQDFVTSFMPVLHRVRITIEAKPDDIEVTVNA